MAGARHHGLIDKLRREMALFAHICLLILAIPLFHPLAQALASGDGREIICTHNGSVVLVDGDDPALHALDDCPCGVLCPSHGGAIPPPQQVMLPVLLPAAAGSTLAPHTETRALPRSWLRPPGRAPPPIL